MLHHKGRRDIHIMETIQKEVDALLRMVKRNPYLYQVGALDEGLEEYVEAVFLEAYIKNDFNIASFLKAPLPHEALIGGIADASGELVRWARNAMDVAEAQRVRGYIVELYEHFLDLEVSRNNKLRQKMSEVRTNLLRLEEIIFNLRLKNEKNSLPGT